MFQPFLCWNPNAIQKTHLFEKPGDLYLWNSYNHSLYVGDISQLGNYQTHPFPILVKMCPDSGGSNKKITGGKKPTMWRRTSGACGTKNFPSSEECFKCGAPRGWAERQIRLKRPGRSPSRRFFVAEENHGNGTVRCEKRCRRRDFCDVPFSSFFPQNIFFKVAGFWKKRVSCAVFFFFSEIFSKLSYTEFTYYDNNMICIIFLKH